MATPRITYDPPEAESAGCSASSSIYYQASGTGYAWEEYSLSATVADGWRFTHFSCHLTAATTNPNPSSAFQTFDDDFTSAPGASPVTMVSSPSVEGEQPIRNGYIDYDVIIEPGSGRDDWTATNIVAHFERIPATQYTFVLSASPAQGGEVSFDDVNYQQTITSTVDTVTDRTLYARPNNGYRFKWFYIPSIGNLTDNPYHYGYQDTGYETAEAVFEVDPTATFTVTAEAKYAAGGIVTGGGTYAAGTTITLSATANQGYRFAGWESSAGDTESSPSFSYTVDSDVTWTAFFGTGRLIYFDRSGSGIDVPGDAAVTIDFDPKLWTCEAYGQDHAVTLTVTPSWGSATTISAQTNPPIPLSKSTLEGGSTFTIGLDAITSCSAGVYPTVTAIIVIQQLNVGTFTLEVPLAVGTQSTATITASGGRITALN